MLITLVSNPLVWWALLILEFVIVPQIPPVKKFWAIDSHGRAPGHLLAKTILVASYPVMFILFAGTMYTTIIWIVELHLRICRV